MKPFSYTRADTLESATGGLAASPAVKLLAGGTNLIDLMKMGVEVPERIVDINRLPLEKIEELPGGKGIRLGAMARNSDVALHPIIAARYPVLSQALLAGASPQLRNMATVGGNLMQRTRCYYFYDPAFPACNKRNPGSGCGAIDGFNRIHAIFGQSEHCIATHPSDMCVGLAAIEAVIRVKGREGEREIPMADFHRLPEDHPEIDTTLRKDEVITGVDLPAADFLRRSYYLKLRDRASYAFALVSVGVALDIGNDKVIEGVRIALAGVAHKPWRAYKAEAELIGKKAGEEAFRKAAGVELAAAKTHRHNAFKVELARRGIVRALTTVSLIA